MAGRRLWLWVPIAALVAILPLLPEWSCGKDLDFHLQSWIDAASQLRHGAVYPRWTFAAAYNAGEPRFTFYPPLSWELGGLLTLVLPFAAVPAVFTWIVLCIAGWAMYRLAQTWAPGPAALIAACLYLANPFMLYTVAMRGACGELLAAAWCPLLFRAVMRERPTVWRVGLPIGLLWLSNVPGAVIGTYTFGLLVAIRLTQMWLTRSSVARGEHVRGVVEQMRVFGGGLAFGMALAAVFLVPAVWERRLIRMEDAYSPGMRATDNLLLLRRLDPVRDAFLLRIEHITAVMVLYGLLVFGAAWWLRRRSALAAAVVAAGVVGMMLAPAAPIWRTLPALWVAQFPWRALFVLSCCLGLGTALVLRDVRMRGMPVAVVSVGLAAALAFPAMRGFRRACGAGDGPRAVMSTLARHHTPEPTEEYVLADADAESMRPDNPPFWLARDSQDFAPGTTPNTTSFDPVALMPAVPQNARLSATPLHFNVVSGGRAFLVVNLQDYPRWQVVRNGVQVRDFQHRPDGLIAFPVQAGLTEVRIVWRRGVDEWVGAAVSLLAVAGWCAAALVRRRGVTGVEVGGSGRSG